MQKNKRNLRMKQMLPIIILLSICFALDTDVCTYEEILPFTCKAEDIEWCDRWAVQGECSTNQKFMLECCKKSCQVCSDWIGTESDLGKEESLKQYLQKIKNDMTLSFVSPFLQKVAEFALEHELFGGFSFHIGSTEGDLKIPAKFSSWNFPEGGRCRIASVTKPVIAAIARKHLDTSKPVSHYYPDLEGSKIAHITIQQLIAHKSGIKNEPKWQLGRTFQDFMKDISQGNFNLGAPDKYSYNNWNYILLGNILEYKDINVIEIVKSMLSENAEFGLNYQAVEDEVQSFLFSEGPYLIENVKYCGGVVVPPEDLLKFAQHYVLIGDSEGKQIDYDLSNWELTHNGSLPGSYTILTQVKRMFHVVSFSINFRQRFNQSGKLAPFEKLNQSLIKMFTKKKI